MSESLPVELNGASVHDIEAPETFTTGGPFHLELRNEGGAVHVHVRLSDALSQVARVDGTNHYVEGGETIRVPVGTAPSEEVTGHIEIVSGYGAERERIDVTLGARTRAVQGPATDGSAGRGADADRDAPRIAPSPRGERKADPGRAGGASRRRSSVSSPSWPLRGGDPELRSSVADVPRETVEFLALAAVAVIVGFAVIAAVRDPILSLVVAGVVTAAVAVAGWLLFS